MIDELMESRKEPVQVTGTSTLDDDDQRKKLTGVFRVESVDLSPISVDRISLAQGRTLVAALPLVLTPHLDDETRQHYVVEEPALGIHSVAQTREALLDEVADDIAFLWDTYVEDTEAPLSSQAQRLGERLRRRFSVAG